MRAHFAGNEAIVSVRDTGVGFPVTESSHIFDMFVQLNSTQGDASAGLCIGLTLVRSLVELHGGRVRTCSDGPGKGATFTISLPTVPAPETALDAPTRARSASGSYSRRRGACARGTARVSC